MSALNEEFTRRKDVIRNILKLSLTPFPSSRPWYPEIATSHKAVLFKEIDSMWSALIS